MALTWHACLSTSRFGAAMPQPNTEVLEILLCQIADDREVNGVVSEVQKHCAKLNFTCDKCHRLAAESGRILTRLSGDNFPDGTPRSVG
jgi:hypothetical protein